MTSDNFNEKNRTKRRGKYLQPVSASQTIEIITRSDKNGEEKIKRLCDEWDESKFPTRTDAVRRTVYDLSWYTDHNPETVLEIMEKRPLYRNWHQGEREIRLFVETSRVEDPGYYSLYPEEVDHPDQQGGSSEDETEGGKSASEGGKEADNESTPQNLSTVSKSRFLSEFDEYCRELRQDLF
jgi:hypothetical protein